MIQNFIKSLGWKDLIFIVVVVFLLYRMRTMEKMTETTNPVSAENLIAIRNLGNLAKTIMPDANSNKLVFPGDVEIKGNVSGNLNVTGLITCNGLNSVDRDIKTPRVTLGKAGSKAGVIAIKDENETDNFWQATNIATKSWVEAGAGDKLIVKDKYYSIKNMNNDGRYLYMRKDGSNSYAVLTSSGINHVKNSTAWKFVDKDTEGASRWSQNI